MDDYVYVEFIKDVKELNLENRQIADLTGIEGFKQLASLYISNNRLTAIDISQNSYLDVLHCDGNELTELDVSNNLINVVKIFYWKILESWVLSTLAINFEEDMLFEEIIELVFIFKLQLFVFTI